MSLSGVSPVAQFINARTDEDKAASNYIKTNQTAKRTIADFEDKAPSITTADGLMKDYNANQVVLGAYNLSQLSGQQAVEKQLLTQDPTSPSSLAQKSSNASWMAFADAFSEMGKNKGTAESSPFTNDVIQSTVKNYEKRQYETSDDLSKNGVGDALYYARKMASGKVKTINDLMSDATLLRVVEVNNGYDPDQFGALDYDQQKRILTNKVNMSDLTDSKKIDRYAEQYLAQLQVHPNYIDNDKPASMIDLFGGDDGVDPILSLFGDDGSSSSGVSSLL